MHACIERETDRDKQTETERNRKKDRETERNRERQRLKKKQTCMYCMKARCMRNRVREKRESKWKSNTKYKCRA